MTEAAPRFCWQCGNPWSGEGRFCSSCGASRIPTPLASSTDTLVRPAIPPAVLPSPQLSPPPPPVLRHDQVPVGRPPRRSRLPLLLAALLALLLVGVVTAGVLLTDDGGEKKPATSGSPAPTASGAPTSTTTSSPGQVTCWDGSSTAAVARCPGLTGMPALAHAFPSLEGMRCESDDNAEKELVLTCAATLDGRPVTIRYSVFTSNAVALAHYRDSYAGIPADTVSDGDRSLMRIWRRTDTNTAGLFRTSGLYVDAPLSFTVAAADSDLRDRAVRELVEYRSTDPRLG